VICSSFNLKPDSASQFRQCHVLLANDNLTKLFGYFPKKATATGLQIEKHFALLPSPWDYNVRTLTMSFFRSLLPTEEENRGNRPTIFDKAKDYVKDEAIGKAQGVAIEFVTGGMITADNVSEFRENFEDDEDEQTEQDNARSEETFNQRLERELAKLARQEAAGVDRAPVASVEPTLASPQPQSPVPTGYDPASRPVMRNGQGFGRKGV
jgi:hypothetical protein